MVTVDTKSLELSNKVVILCKLPCLHNYSRVKLYQKLDAPSEALGTHFIVSSCKDVISEVQELEGTIPIICSDILH